MCPTYPEWQFPEDEPPLIDLSAERRIYALETCLKRGITSPEQVADSRFYPSVKAC